jgi:hypothetical protein
MRFSDGTIIKSEAFLMDCSVDSTPSERLEWLKNLQTKVDSHNCNCDMCDYEYEYNFVKKEIKVIEKWMKTK